MIYTVANLKGGPGKTTTSMFLAAGLDQRGSKVTLVDADAQGSALSWAEKTEPRFLTVAMPTRTIHTQIGHLLADPSDDVVIDTPPQGRLVISSAIRAAATAASGGIVIVPVQPTTGDIDQLGETMELIKDSAGLDQVRVVILLTRVLARTKALRQIRESLAEGGLEILQAEVRQSQALALAHGAPITDLGDYADVLTELTEKVPAA